MAQMYNWWLGRNVLDVAGNYFKKYPNMSELIKRYRYKDDDRPMFSIGMAATMMDPDRAKMFPYLRWIVETNES